MDAIDKASAWYLLSPLSLHDLLATAIKPHCLMYYCAAVINPLLKREPEGFDSPF